MTEREAFDCWLNGLTNYEKEMTRESLLWLCWRASREADPLVTYTTAPIKYDYRNVTSEKDVNAGITINFQRVRKVRCIDEQTTEQQRDTYKCAGQHEVWTVVEYRRACMEGKMREFKSAT